MTERRDLLGSGGELVNWSAAGRPVRGGPWAQQAETTLDRIDGALSEARLDDAADLVVHMVVEATEIHELYTAWCREIPQILLQHGVPAIELTQLEADLLALTGAAAISFDDAWEDFGHAAEHGATTIRAGRGSAELVQQIVSLWTEAHDIHLMLTAGWVDIAARRLGEERLGALWTELQGEGIADYSRYDLEHQPWNLSFARLTQTALEGMHAHFGGPSRRGEVELTEHADRVTMRFESCGSGGQIVDRHAYGVTSERHPFAWNETGVCHYCIHCCVLQQLEPIKRLGYPARVIDPPLEPGAPCTWTVYRDPSLVPDDAFRRVGQTPPREAHHR